MYKANALTDTIGLVIAVSFALQIAIGAGLANLVDLLTWRMSYRLARLVTICCSGLFGGTLGVIAWQVDGELRWIGIGVLAGLLAGAGQRLVRGAMQRTGSDRNEASRCWRPVCCRGGIAESQDFESAGRNEGC